MKQKVKHTSRYSDFRILIADDDKHLVNTLSTLFRGEGFRVFNAPSIDRTIDRLLKGSYDLIILDVQMPQKPKATAVTDAGVVISQIITNLSLVEHDTTVILFTAFPSVQHSFAAIDAGAYYLPKTLPNLNVSQQLVSQCIRIADKKLRRDDSSPSWLDLNYDVLLERFPGQTIAVLDTGARRGNHPRHAFKIGDRIVLTGRTSAQLRKSIAFDSELSRSAPVIIDIPTKGNGS